VKFSPGKIVFRWGKIVTAQKRTQQLNTQGILGGLEETQKVNQGAQETQGKPGKVGGGVRLSLKGKGRPTSFRQN